MPLPLLATLPPVPRADGPDDAACYPAAVLAHPRRNRRMRLALAREVLRWLGVTPGGWVADPLAGFGTTALAAHQLGAQALLVDEDPTLAGPLAEVAAATGSHYSIGDATLVDTRAWAGRVKAVLLSPPFPKSRHAGGTAKQRAFMGAAAMHVEGQVFAGQDRWRNRPAFQRTLAAVVAPWREALCLGGWIAVHVRDHTHRNARVRVDEWAADGLRDAGYQVLGILAAPHTAPTFLRAIRSRPRRKVVEVFPGADGARVELLECFHLLPRAAGVLPVERADCPECPPTAAALIREDWVVIGCV